MCKRLARARYVLVLPCMKATDLLRNHHEELSELFEQIEETASIVQKVNLFEVLAAKLVAHDAIERELFYPACELTMGRNELLGESHVEHSIIEFSLFKTDQHLGDEEFANHLSVLEEMIDHHVEQEEIELFPKVEKVMDAAALDRLGQEMQERYEEVLNQDFRQPLTKDIYDVISGGTKTPRVMKKVSRSGIAQYVSDIALDPTRKGTA